MRYIGNKTRLLDNIEQLLDEKHLTKGVFADLFTGTGSVADHFKDRFTIIANDIEYYSTNKELVNWIKENDYKVVDVGRAGRRFPRHEVLIKNY